MAIIHTNSLPQETVLSQTSIAKNGKENFHQVWQQLPEPLKKLKCYCKQHTT